jgi:hypothetical protein
VSPEPDFHIVAARRWSKVVGPAREVRPRAPRRVAFSGIT